MEPALRELIKVLPPPPDPTGRDVNWREHEHALGITYPTWLKEFIAVYGGGVAQPNWVARPESTRNLRSRHVIEGRAGTRGAMIPLVTMQRALI